MNLLFQNSLRNSQTHLIYAAIRRRNWCHGTNTETNIVKPTEMSVQGLSQKVVSVPVGEVGPGASKQSHYKNPEYFCYSNSSFFEAEVELRKYRLPQPTNKK